MQQITAYEIKNQQLSSISVEFDFFSVVDRPERPVELITLDQNKLKIALIEEDLNVTNKNLIYEWNDEWFQYKGVINCGFLLDYTYQTAISFKSRFTISATCFLAFIF